MTKKDSSAGLILSGQGSLGAILIFQPFRHPGTKLLSAAPCRSPLGRRGEAIVGGDQPVGEIADGADSHQARLEVRDHVSRYPCPRSPHGHMSCHPGADGLL